jgi:outer membrane protein assembly factor BamB
MLGLLLLLQSNWPMFRGASHLGVTADPPPPVSWNADAEAGPLKNVLWKTPIPGLGHSSPILWQGTLYLATAVRSAGEAPLKLGLYGAGDSADDRGEQSWGIDGGSGRVIWRETARKAAPRVQRHTKATHANTTLATDGRRLVAFFGSEGLYCYSLKGDLLWSKDLGVLDMGPLPELQWGFASSPVIHKGVIIVQSDSKKDPFLAAFRLDNGEEIWRTSRTGVSERSWATPSVHTFDGRTQIVTNGWPYIAGYDFTTGKELWRLKSEGDIPVPTPISWNRLIYVTNAHGGPAPLYAIRPTAQGDISLAAGSRANEHVAWSTPRNGAYMQTPVILGDLIYSCSDRGVLKVFDAKTGAMQYEQRLGAGTTGFSASPVAAGGYIYQSSEEGEIYVIKAGPAFELMATNHMGESVMATPVVSGGVIYIRTRGHLISIGHARPETPQK